MTRTRPSIAPQVLLSLLLLALAGQPSARADKGPGAWFSTLRQHATVQRLLRARGRFQKLGRQAQPLRRAGESLSDLSMAPADRRRILAEAAGAPLTDVSAGVLRALLELIPPGGGGKAADQLDRMVKSGGQARRIGNDQWWGKLLPQEFKQTGAALDRLALAAQQPEFRSNVDRALSVVRIAGKLEAESLAQIAINVPKDRRPLLRAALTQYSLGLALTLVRGVNGQRLTAEEGRAITSMMDGVARLVEQGLLSGGQGQDASMAGAVAGITTAAMTLSSGVDQRVAAIRRAPGTAVNWRMTGLRVMALNRRLLRSLDAAMETTPESRAALRSLAKDVELTGRYALGMTRLIGAAGNSDMRPEERARHVKEAVEGMGPMAIKMLQTLVNQSGAMDLFGLDGDGADSPVMGALISLQDQVTAMPMEQVRRQIRSSLGRELEDAFVEFSPKPIAAASIGQVHLAKIRVRNRLGSGSRLVEVAVKVQRPGLVEEFKDAVRASRLAVGVVREAVGLLGGEMLSVEQRQKIEKALGLVEGTVGDFVQSFAIESDFRREVRTMKSFSRSMRSSSHVVVPQIFDKHCGESVITMAFLRGDKLPAYLDRHAVAQEARNTPLPTEPLPAGSPLAEVEERARLFAEQTYGLKPRAVVVEPSRQGYRAQVTFDHQAQRRAQLEIGRDGRIRARGPAPDLSARGVGELRDILLTSFVSQMVVHRHLHGDLHKGNFLILPDGKTIGLLDYGQMVRLSGRHFVAPARLISGFLAKKPGEMAKALVGMSEQYTSMKRGERQRAARAVEEHLQAALKAGGTWSVETVMQSALQASIQSGLTLSSVYMQWMKTSFAMSGNLSCFKQKGIPVSLPQTALHLTRGLSAEAACKGTLWELYLQSQKRRRVNQMSRLASP